MTRTQQREWNPTKAPPRLIRTCGSCKWGKFSTTDPEQMREGRGACQWPDKLPEDLPPLPIALFDPLDGILAMRSIFTDSENCPVWAVKLCPRCHGTPATGTTGECRQCKAHPGTAPVFE